MPYNTSVATFRMCRLELAHRGVNLPCVSDASVEYTAIDPTAVSDHALWNVGPLHNFALRSSSGDDDAVRFRVAAQLVGISPGAEGQTVLMPVGVSYNAETVWIGHSDVLLTSGNDVDISQVTPVVELIISPVHGVFVMLAFFYIFQLLQSIRKCDSGFNLPSPTNFSS